MIGMAFPPPGNPASSAASYEQTEGENMTVEYNEFSEFEEKAVRLLIECYNSIHRQSWEEGKTENEVMDDVCCFLWNLGLQPGLPAHESAVNTFMEKTRT